MSALWCGLLLLAWTLKQNDGGSFLKWLGETSAIAGRGGFSSWF